MFRIATDRRSSQVLLKNRQAANKLPAKGIDSKQEAMTTLQCIHFIRNLNGRNIEGAPNKRRNRFIS